MQGDEQTQVHLIGVGLRYQYLAPGGISSSGQGLVIGLSLNLSRLVSKKWVVGVFGASKSRELFWPSRFNAAFASAAESDAEYTGLASGDSLLGSYFVRTLGKNELGGCGRYQYGVQFRPPIRWFPIVKLYRGGTNELLDVGELQGVVTDDSDWIYFWYPHYGVELSLVFPGTGLDLQVDRTTGSFVSIFYERYDLGPSVVNGLPLSSFLSSSFLSDHSGSGRIGLKVGLELW